MYPIDQILNATPEELQKMQAEVNKKLLGRIVVLAAFHIGVALWIRSAMH